GVSCLCGTGQTPSVWGVRKGVCPGCGRALFGTTLVYQHLPGLDLVYPESPYLCLTCDRSKIVAVQRHYHAAYAEERPGGRDRAAARATYVHVSAGPPTIPYSRISRVRF